MFIFLFSFVGLLCEEMVLFAAIAVIFFCIENFNWILLGILGVIAVVILFTLIGKLLSYISYNISFKKELKKNAGKYWHIWHTKW